MLRAINGDGEDFCTYCGSVPGESHSEECKQDWRSTILSYGQQPAGGQEKP